MKEVTDSKLNSERAEPKMCGECGAIHRPGENTCCPGWRPENEARQLRAENAELQRLALESHTCKRLHCTADERAVLELAEEWYQSWVRSAGTPPEDLPEERALFLCIAARQVKP